MTFFFAPMEGVTVFSYRRIHRNWFPEIDRYYSPFVTPNHAHHFTKKEFRDVLPEHNEGVPLVPQLLTNDASDFVWAAGELKKMGYDEVNLNLGCPSGTVVAKHRGAGFLEDPAALDHFFAQVFDTMPEIHVSVKTRIGLEDPAEWERLLAVYNRWPLLSLVVHPRIRRDFYRNRPNYPAFQCAVETSRHRLCYNGDLFHVSDIQAISEKFPAVDALMCGRGLVANPALVREARGGAPLQKQELQEFLDEILAQNCMLISGDRNIIFRMLDIWGHMDGMFTNGDRYLKRIRKSRVLSEYRAVVAALFREQELVQNCAFRARGNYR